MSTRNTPEVSVVIPVFNAGPYLARAVESVATQTHPNVQLVLVDGGSSDGSAQWIEHYARQNPCVTDFLPPGTPAALTWTRASELAEGPYVTLLCQDDVLYPHALESQVAAIHSFPQASMVSAKRDIIDSSGRILKHSRGAQGIAPGIHPGQSLIRVAFQRATNVFGEPLSVLFRKDALLAHMPWDDTHPFMLDLDMYRRVLNASYGVVSHDTVGAFRVSASSWSTRLAKSQEQQFRSWLDATAMTMNPPPTRQETRQSRFHLREQSLLRRGAYSWLRIRSRI